MFDIHVICYFSNARQVFMIGIHVDDVISRGLGEGYRQNTKGHHHHENFKPGIRLEVYACSFDQFWCHNENNDVGIRSAAPGGSRELSVMAFSDAALGVRRKKTRRMIFHPADDCQSFGWLCDVMFFFWLQL